MRLEVIIKGVTANNKRGDEKLNSREILYVEVRKTEKLAKKTE